MLSTHRPWDPVLWKEEARQTHASQSRPASSGAYEQLTEHCQIGELVSLTEIKMDTRWECPARLGEQAAVAEQLYDVLADLAVA